MKRHIALAGALLALASTVPAHADTLLDPLHFSCGNCAIDNGTVTPTTGGAPVDITVTSSPANSGNLILDILVPDNYTLPVSDGVTGTVNGTAFNGTASLFSAAPWTSGSLEHDYEGITNFHNGSPPNNITAWLPSTQGVDPSANGYFVLTIDIGNVSLNTPGGSSPIDLSLTSLGLGGLVLGVLETSAGDITTAQSAALFVDPTISSTPIPNSLALMIGGLMFIFAAGKKWGRKTPPITTYEMTAA
jgi:hypothetical protein